MVKIIYKGNVRNPVDNRFLMGFVLGGKQPKVTVEQDDNLENFDFMVDENSKIYLNGFTINDMEGLVGKGEEIML